MRAGTPASSAPGSWSRGTMLSATASRVASDAASRGPGVRDWARALLGLRKTMEVHRKLPRKVRRPDLSERGHLGVRSACPLPDVHGQSGYRMSTVQDQASARPASHWGSRADPRGARRAEPRAAPGLALA